MSQDARFEEGGGSVLRLRALDEEDLRVVSALTQDAVFPAKEMTWRRSERRFAILLNRFRWEDVAAAKQPRREYQRVQSTLVVEDAMAVRSQRVDRQDPGAVLCLLSIDWQASEEGAGSVTLTLSGGGTIRIEVEALEVILRDVTRPYLAPSGRSPRHE